MEQLQENIKKLEKGLDNPYISTEMKGKLINKITELKAELEAKQNPPQLSTKDLEARLTIVKEMVKEDPSLKPRLIILKEMIKESKKEQPKLKEGGTIPGGLREVWDNEEDRFIYDNRIEILKQAGFTTSKGLPNPAAKKSAKLLFDKLPLNIKYPLIEKYKKGEIELFEGGGEISIIDFHENDYKKLIGDSSQDYPFYSVKNGKFQDIHTEKEEIKVAIFNPAKRELKIVKNAPKQLKDRLNKWLEENSYNNFIKN